MPAAVSTALRCFHVYENGSMSSRVGTYKNSIAQKICIKQCWNICYNQICLTYSQVILDFVKEFVYDSSYCCQWYEEVFSKN